MANLNYYYDDEGQSMSAIYIKKLLSNVDNAVYLDELDSVCDSVSRSYITYCMDGEDLVGLCTSMNDGRNLFLSAVIVHSDYNSYEIGNKLIDLMLTQNSEYNLYIPEKYVQLYGLDITRYGKLHYVMYGVCAKEDVFRDIRVAAHVSLKREGDYCIMFKTKDCIPSADVQFICRLCNVECTVSELCSHDCNKLSLCYNSMLEAIPCGFRYNRCNGIHVVCAALCGVFASSRLVNNAICMSFCACANNIYALVVKGKDVEWIADVLKSCCVVPVTDVEIIDKEGRVCVERRS